MAWTYYLYVAAVTITLALWLVIAFRDVPGDRDRDR